MNPGKPRLNLPKKQSPPQPHHHECFQYTWTDARRKSEYEHLPEFLEC